MCVVAGSMAGAGPASAQDPPPPIPRFVIDLHATAPMFPSDLQQLASSRTPPLNLSALPGWGLGAQAGLHVYIFKWKALTVGIGGEVMAARAHSTALDATSDPPLQPADERFVSASPQLSFNFGTGHGWSYLSGGIGRAQWSLHSSSAPTGPADAEVLPVVNYGGGARWFIKRHLAFSFDVRVYQVEPGSSFGGNPGSPRAQILTIGAGISVK
jgi:hypothetical protein